MDPLAALPQPVIDALARGSSVLTGNQRAARTLRSAYELRQRALGLTHWQPPAILAWDSWLATLWRHLLLEGYASDLLLNSTQEHALWRSIIAADPGASSLRPLDSLAKLAADAWSRFHAYGARRRLQAAAGTTDTRAFARWAAEFERRCLRAQYITTAQLPNALAEAIATGQATPPPALLLVGFDHTTPAQAALLDAIRAAGTQIEQLHPADGQPQYGAVQPQLLIDAPDPHSELLACARWLRQQLTEHPRATLAVIVPDIDAERAAIDRAFRDVLAPELQDIAAAVPVPYEFSLGVPLDRTPIVSAALDILRWCGGPLALDRVSALLLSPHFAADTPGETGPAGMELLARAEFDAFRLRAQPLLEPQITLDSLAGLASGAQLTRLRQHLRALVAATRRSTLSRDRSHADWAAAFQEALDAAGWAPVSALDSAEFQTRAKWEDALDELATLDFDPQAGRVSYSSALDALARIAAQTLFAPESRHASVQIMGPLESAGSSFDALWFLRAGDLAWPPVPATNPLLPFSLQRDCAMPGADIAQDSARAIHVTRRIAASAPAVVFSYAQQTSNGRQRPSPVLSGLSLTAHAAPAISVALIPVLLEHLLDAAPIPSPPSQALRGGASILEAQAACPFRAFAERRLFSTALESVPLGLDARDRGSIVHSVLHDFWAQVRTQAALREMHSADRDAMLAQCIDSALARDHARPAAGWPSAYIDSERKRLFRLLRSWIRFEAEERAPFTVKSQEEELKGVRIGPLHLDVRVDRVDQTVPGASGEPPAEIILDYKTGSAQPAAWNGDRPDAPQLPLYAVVSPAPRLAAVAFASVRPGREMGLAGLQSQPGILPAARGGAVCDLEAKRAEWSGALTALAEEFHAGSALATPKDYPMTCRYCRQRLLCRLDLASLAPEAEDLDYPDTNSAAGPAQESDAL